MKSLSKLLKSSFLTKVALIVAVFSLLVASISCNHDKGGGGNPKPEPNVKEVKLTSIKLAGKSISLSDVMDVGITRDAEVALELESDPKDASITFSPASSIKGYDSTKKTGTWSLDVGKKTLKISVKKGDKSKEYTLKIERVDEGEPILTSLKVDGKQITPITESMTAEPTKKNKVKVEYESSPAESVVTTSPNLDNSEWKGLVDGENELTITVTKGAKTRNYTLKITKSGQTPGDAPKLTSITVGKHKKDGGGIVLEDVDTIEIPVPTEYDGASYEVSYEVDQEGASVTFNPPLENGNKIKFDKVELDKITDDYAVKEFSIKVSKGDKENSYRLRAIMMTNAMGIFGARYMGDDTSATVETIQKILRGEKDVNVEIAGDKAELIVSSRIARWETIKCNGNDIKDILLPGEAYKGRGISEISLGELGNKTSIELIVSNSEWENGSPLEPWKATEKFNFNIVCSSKKADAFINKIYVNDKDITDESQDADAFTNLFADEGLSEIESGKKASIAVELSKEVEKVTIGDKTINKDALIKDKDQFGEPLFIAKVEGIDVAPDVPKEISIVVSPKAEDSNYRETTMKFMLVYKEPETKIYPKEYAINGTNDADMSEMFKESLFKGYNPLYKVNTNLLAMHLAFDKKPTKVEMILEGVAPVIVEGSDIKEVDSTYGGHLYVVNLTGAIGDENKQVTLKFWPEDVGSLSKGEWQFKIKGTNTKPKIAPRFISIAKDSNLPKSFLDGLEGSEKPEYKVFGTRPNFIIDLTEYEHDFLLDKIEVNVNGNKVDSEFDFYEYGFYISWRLKQTIKITSSAGTDVEVKFIAKNIAESVTWTFNLKTGGKKPGVPRNYIRFDVGDYSNKIEVAGFTGENNKGIPFPNAFWEGIKSGSEPLIELYGKNVTIRFAALYDMYLKNGKFKMDSGDEVEEGLNGSGQTIVEHTFENVSLNDEHTIIATVVPGDANNYDELEYKFKIKVVSELPAPPNCLFLIDGEAKPNNYQTTLENDFAILSFKTKDNIIKKVKIGKTGALTEVPLTEQKDNLGNVFYIASKEIDLSTTSIEDCIIEAEPNNASSYATFRCKYRLQGGIMDSNASFMRENKKAKIYAKMNFKEGVGGELQDDYGVQSVDFTVFTMAKESSVKAIKVHELTHGDMGDVGKGLTRKPNTRELTGNVKVYEDKPTRVKLQVTSKDGQTDSINGVFSTVFNPIPLYWSYKDIKSVKYGTQSYAEIRVSKAKVKNDKVHILFAPWSEEEGFKVSLDAVSKNQTPFQVVGALGDYQTIYKTALEVKDLQSGQEAELMCKIISAKTNKEAITYKVKVIMED